MKPAIVVSAYNRPVALRRLLASLHQSAHPSGGGVPLVISIDCGASGIHGDVREIAERFVWPFGPKEVLFHDRHLGLVGHVFFCLGLTETYGDVIFLEDDLVVSPLYYVYATQALDFYRADDRIAGLSLYALWFNGYTQQPFVPLADDGDTFFIQVPYTQGQAFTVRQWRTFAAWHASADPRTSPLDNLHRAFGRLGADEWFPLLAAYVVDTRRYVAYPRISLTTGAGDAGTHFAQRSVFFQVPLQRLKTTAYRFQSLDEAAAVYDSFFEILPDRLTHLTDALPDVEYDVDLYASKEPRHLRAEYVLTTRPCRRALRSFGQTMWPIEANVIDGEPGAEICLCRREDVRWDWLANVEVRKRNHDYFSRRRHLSRSLRLQFAALDLLQYAGRWVGLGKG